MSVVNVDDPYGRRLAAELPEARHLRGRAARPTTAPRICAAACDGAQLRAAHAQRASARAAAAAARALQRRQRARRAGRAHALGVQLDALLAALERGVRVPGRFEPVDEGQDFAVLVDYAHTPDSLENVLRAARELLGRRASGRVHLRVRRRRRPRPRQAAADGRDRRAAGRHHGRDLRQPALGGARGDHRGDPGGRPRGVAVAERWTASQADGRPPRRDRARRSRLARARRRGGDRRQGPRAGPGVRRRAQAALRRRDGRQAKRSTRARRGQRGRRGDERLGRPARRRRGRGASCSATARAGAAGDGAARAVAIDSRDGRAGRAVRGAARRARRRWRARARRRSRRAPGGCWSRPSTRQRLCEAPRARRGARPPGPAARPCRTLARAWRSELGARGEGDRDHRLDRQDLDQGHPRRAARPHACAPPPARENLNTEIGLPLAILAAPPRTPRRWCWSWRCAAPARSPS